MPSSTECIERESQDDIERFCEAAAAVKQDCRPEDQVIMDAIAKSEGEKYAPQAAEKLDKSAGTVRVRWLRLKELLAQCIANHVDSTVDNIKERLQGICLPLYVDQGLLHKILNSQLPTKLALIAASSIMIITGTFIGREILQQPPYNFEASESTKTDVLNLFKITLQWTEPTVQEGDVIAPSAGGTDTPHALPTERYELIGVRKYGTKGQGLYCVRTTETGEADAGVRVTPPR